MGNSHQQSSGPLQEISLDLLFELAFVATPVRSWIINCMVSAFESLYIPWISESSCLLLDPVIWIRSYVCWMFSWFEDIHVDQIIKFDCLRSKFLIQSFVSGLDLQIWFFVCIFICSIDLYFICISSPFVYCSIVHLHRLHASAIIHLFAIFLCKLKL